MSFDCTVILLASLSAVHNHTSLQVVIPFLSTCDDAMHIKTQLWYNTFDALKHGSISPSGERVLMPALGSDIERCYSICRVINDGKKDIESSSGSVGKSI